MKVKEIAIASNPSPYEYALLSRAAYYDNKEHFRAKELKIYEELKRLGWKLKASIAEVNDYYGSIWVNKRAHQVVISHRGSENKTSWITDLESVVMGQKREGGFISSAIDTLSHPTVLDYEKRGFRISSTGHSLGGFLAQICVYWSKRREFQHLPNAEVPVPSSSSSSSSSTSTSPSIRANIETAVAKDISAVVFDSPGAYEFLQTLQSNLPAEKAYINLKSLDVHNFCPQPTIVNTFGTQVGRVWHLGGVSDDVKLAFVFAHKMINFLDCFDPETGQARVQIQMTDWPQADYSVIENLPERIVGKILKAPFDCIDALYRWIASKFGRAKTVPTWYQQIFTDPSSEVSIAMKNPDLDEESFAKVLVQAIYGHYARLDGESSRHSMALYHFEPEIQAFLKDLAEAKRQNLDKLGWQETMIEIYGKKAASLLLNISLDNTHACCNVVAPSWYVGNMFQLQQDLHRIVNTCGIISTVEFMHSCVDSLNDRLQKLETKIQQVQAGTELHQKYATEIQALQSKLNSIEENNSKGAVMSAASRPITKLTAHSQGVRVTEPYNKIIKTLGPEDIDPEHIKAKTTSFEAQVKAVDSSQRDEVTFLFDTISLEAPHNKVTIKPPASLPGSSQSAIFHHKQSADTSQSRGPVSLPPPK